MNWNAWPSSSIHSFGSVTICCSMCIWVCAFFSSFFLIHISFNYSENVISLHWFWGKAGIYIYKMPCFHIVNTQSECMCNVHVCGCHLFLELWSIFRQIDLLNFIFMTKKTKRERERESDPTNMSVDCLTVFVCKQIEPKHANVAPLFFLFSSQWKKKSHFNNANPLHGHMPVDA